MASSVGKDHREQPLTVEYNPYISAVDAQRRADVLLEATIDNHGD